MEPTSSARHYSHRPKPYSNELELKLTDRELAAERGRSRQVYALSGIERIRLSYSPRNTARLVFRCEMRMRDGKSVSFDSLSWKSLILTEKQDDAYRAFIAALVARAAAASPRVALEAGIGVLRYRAMLIIGIVLVALVAAAAGYFVSIPRATLGPARLLYAGLSAAAALYLGLWLREFLTRNRPRVFSPDALPESVLPATES